MQVDRTEKIARDKEMSKHYLHKETEYFNRRKQLYMISSPSGFLFAGCWKKDRGK